MVALIEALKESEKLHSSVLNVTADIAGAMATGESRICAVFGRV